MSFRVFLRCLGVAGLRWLGVEGVFEELEISLYIWGFEVGIVSVFLEGY